MKRNMKRLPALLLAIILCLSLLPVTAGADFGSQEVGWTLTANEPCHLSIINDNGMVNWTKVSSTYGPFVSTVELSDGITTIPDRAFYKCSILTTIEIPATVTTIGSGGVFVRCTGLTSITVAENNANFTAEDGILYNKNKTELLICPQGKSGVVEIPSSVTEIGSYAFSGCTKITSVTIPEGVTSIGNAAFEGCTGLTSVTLPASLTSLGDGVFQDCTGLTSLSVASGNTAYTAEGGVLYDSGKTKLLFYPAEKTDTTFTVPDSVTAIEDNAFNENSHLQTVSANALASIGDGAFLNCTSLTSFTAQSMETVGAQAFSGCSQLATFTLEDEDSLTTIGEEAFSGCGVLTAAPLSGAATIGDSAFQNCTALTSLSFCETGSVDIGESAFSGCTGLTALTIPASVTSIGAKAFDSCNNVGEIIFEGKTPPTCGDNMISVGNVYEFQIIVPEGSESSYQTNLGNTLKDYVSSARKYPLFVNGRQFTSKELSIACGSGTAAFDVNTSTLTLTDATINTMGGNYGYGGAINSGLENLTILLVGNNTIHAQGTDHWGDPYYDSINSDRNCNITIASGETGGSMPTLTCDVMDIGRGNWPHDGSENAGNLTVDGVTLTVEKYIWVQHNITFQNGAQVNVTGDLTANHNAAITVTGDTTNVTVASISMGNGTDYSTNNNELELTSGTLTVTGDSNCAISFDPASTGSIVIKGGTFETKNENGKATNLAENKITVDNSLEMTGSWDSGPVLITAKPDGKVAVTVTADPTGAGTVAGGGRYEPDTSVTVTAAPKPGYYFMGWYEGGTQKSTDTSYTFEVEESGAVLTAKFGVDYLTLAEQAKETFASAVNNNTLSWATLVQAVEAYKEAEDFVKNPPSGFTDATTRYAALTTYYNGIEKLDLSNQNLGSADLTKLDSFTSLTELNLSGTGVSDLSALERLTNLETLDLSNTAITNNGLSSLSGLTDKLKNLDISGTRVTALDKLVPEGSCIFPGSETLTAKNLSLTSLSALAKAAGADGFNTDAVTKWDFTGSTLTDTEDNKADVETIKTTLGEKFSPPTIQTTPVTPEEPVGGGSTGGSSGYSISVPASTSIKGGSITVSPRSAEKGDTVTITVKPDDGYELSKLTVTDAKGNGLELTDKGSGKYTFAMPGSSVKIQVSFKEIAEQVTNPFTDVYESDYYYDAVLWAVANGVTNGTSATTFSPNAPVTRAQMVTFLWRAYGSPKATGSNPFADVSADAYYYDAVLWAVANGVTNGTSATTFSPDAPVTRSQAVTFQWRAAGSPVVAGDSFDDVAADAYYAGAVTWAVANGITNGTGGNKFSPEVTVTRAQAVTFLWRELA